MANEILFKPNGLILATANNTITSSEFKVYETLLHRCQITKDSHWRKATISREELKTIIKASNQGTVEELKKVLIKFMSININFKLGTKHVGATLLADYVYDPETDIFTCSMSENVFTALMTYREIGYSPIDLKLVRQAKGFYTQKVYGLLRIWSRYNEKVTKIYTVQQIKDVCDIPIDTSYDEYGNFKKKVLLPAIKEINKKLNMEVDYKEIKTVRKVTSIEFTILDHEPRKYNFNDKREKVIKVEDNIGEKPIVEIESVDYVDLIDAKINESVHERLITDYPEFKEIMKQIIVASEKTLSTLGGKTINKRNYKYFKTTLENLLPNI